MIRIIKKEVNEREESISVSMENVNKVSNLLLSKLIDGERDKVMMALVGMFGRLNWEELEEVYMDGCLVIWNKVKMGKVSLGDGGIVNYLIKVCRNIGMHYLRKVRDDVEYLEELMGEDDVDEERCGLDVMFDVVDSGMNEDCDDEVMNRLSRVWERLSDVDKMILVSYYWDGMKMEEIVKRVGYKSVDSVKSKKSKCLKKMLKMMRQEKAAVELPSFFAFICYWKSKTRYSLMQNFNTCASSIECDFRT